MDDERNRPSRFAPASSGANQKHNEEKMPSTRTMYAQYDEYFPDHRRDLGEVLPAAQLIGQGEVCQDNSNLRRTSDSEPPNQVLHSCLLSGAATLNRKVSNAVISALLLLVNTRLRNNGDDAQ
jgi:hypothetical protein